VKRLTPMRVRAGRRGLCFALLALLMPVLVGFTGLCIDLGVVALCNGHLKTVADAAALAGAKQYASTARLAPGFNVSTLTPAAQQRAQTIGQSNRALNQPAVLIANPYNLPAGDIVVGYQNLQTPGLPLDTSVASSQRYNAVQVTSRRDATHGGVVPAFFGQMIGFQGAQLSVTSTATAQNYAVQGFKCTPSGYTKLIPIALSQTTYNAMLSSLTTDNYNYNYKTGLVVPGPDGIYESNTYPANSGAGNWGTVKIGVTNNSSATLVSQIQNGVSTAEIANTSPNGCSLVLTTTSLGGNPGISLGIKTALIGLIGQVVVVPIYDPVASGGTGNNYSYAIVQFAAVVVLDVVPHGSQTQMLVQPAFVVDPTIILGAPLNSWTQGGVIRLRLTR